MTIVICQVISTAQNKKLSPSDEAHIQAKLQESEKKGVPEWEREKLKKLLIKKYRTQTPTERNSPPQVNSACTNADFENGNYNGWVLTSGNINGTTLPCYTCASAAGGIANITTATNSGAMWTNGIDNCTDLPVVAPGGGNYSLALNDNTSGGKLQDIKYTFGVTPGNAHFTIRYMVVLQSGGHAPSDQPYYMCRMLDASNNVVPGTLNASTAGPGWGAATATVCAGAEYQGWKTNCFDLTAYMGQNVTFEFQVSDCNAGGHFGYAYLDASCLGGSTGSLTTYMCAGSTTQEIVAPAGYTNYQWFGPNNHNPIAGPNGTNDTLMITNGQVGDVYYLKDSTTTPNGCYGTDSATLQITNPMWVNYSGSHTGIINDTGTIHLCQGDTLVLKGSGASTYTWSAGVTDGVAFYPTSSGSYTLAGNSSPGCIDTVIVYTVVQPCNTTGIGSVLRKNTIEVFPNPSSGIFTVQAKNKVDEIRITDVAGRIVYECWPESMTIPILLESNGIYFVQVRCNNRMSNFKLVVNK